MDIIEMENAVKRGKLEYEKAAKQARLLDLKRQMLEIDFNKAKVKLEYDKIEMSIMEVEEQIAGL